MSTDSSSPTQNLRQRAEDKLAEPGSAEGQPSDLSPYMMERALHELRVHQIELQMQNQELRHTQIALDTARARFADLYDHAPVGYVTLNDAGLILQANQMAANMLGLPVKYLVQTPLNQYIFAEDQDAHYLRSKQLLTADREQSAELRMVRPDGTPFWVQMDSNTALDDNGTPVRRVVLSDITQRKADQDKLSLAASVFSQSREGIMITQTDGKIIDVNDAFGRITGYSRDEVVGQSPRILSSGHHSKEFYEAMWRDLKDKGHWYGEVWNRRKSGELYAELQTVTTVRDAQNRPAHYVSLFSDITAYKAQQNQLTHLAHYDLLTNLPNRALLADRLQQNMVQTLRRGDLMGVAYIDLDNFKSINDTHGHEVGDMLLTALANRMKDALREGDTLARIGGDEFVVALTELDNVAASLPMLERLLEAAAEPVQVGALLLQVSASLGITFYPQTEAVGADQLLRQADQAMYQAKQAGRNRYHLFDQARDRSVRGHHESLGRIQQALRDQELVLHYQPKVNMRTGQVMGVEALIRWQHPERGLLAPAAFLPVIESDDLAIVVGEWVIHTALTQLGMWRAQGLDLTLSVNIGAHQLQQTDFAVRLRALLLEHPVVLPSQLQLEILETSALQDIGSVSQVIEDCNHMGVAFALDDFGTGYSSLTYLKRLRVAMLKIDQSFVRDMLDDPDDLSILKGVIGLAHAFHREVIAEGVETVAHGTLLLQLGCELAQGYGIARPMPASDLPAWVQSWRPDPAWAG